jgi:hypothetical protein
MGLGRESCVPPGPRLSPLNVSRPSASNGHAWIPAEQNTFGALALTLGFIRASSRRAALRSSPRNGTASGPLTGGWTRRRRAAPRQSPTRAPQRASDRARWSTSDTEEDGAAAGPPMGGRAAVERILSGLYPRAPSRIQERRCASAIIDSVALARWLLPTQRPRLATDGGVAFFSHDSSTSSSSHGGYRAAAMASSAHHQPAVQVLPAQRMDLCLERCSMGKQIEVRSKP